jgi:hypothetical protein
MSRRDNHAATTVHARNPRPGSRSDRRRSAPGAQTAPPVQQGSGCALDRIAATHSGATIKTLEQGSDRPAVVKRPRQPRTRRPRTGRSLNNACSARFRVDPASQAGARIVAVASGKPHGAVTTGRARRTAGGHARCVAGGARPCPARCQQVPSRSRQGISGSCGRVTGAQVHERLTRRRSTAGAARRVVVMATSDLQARGPGPGAIRGQLTWQGVRAGGQQAGRVGARPAR